LTGSWSEWISRAGPLKNGPSQNRKHISLQLSLGHNGRNEDHRRLMDIAEIDPLLRALSQLLKPRARFVFSISHPCFNSTAGMKMIVERTENRDGEHVVVHAIQISQYATPTTYKGIGIIGQPTPQYYFHRPLNALFGACFRAGFVLDALAEPTFDANAQPNRPFSWENYHEIPPVLIARVRLV